MKELKKVYGTSGKSKGVIGIDEVGRGPLAGPITLCAAYIMEPEATLKDLFQNTIRDSKSINKSLRNNIYQIVRKKRKLDSSIIYTISSRSSAYIDKHGLTKSVNACLLDCIHKLSKKGVDVYALTINLDAGLKIPLENVVQRSFIKGDERFIEIALASIMAKEWRDAYMRRLSDIFPNYNWHRNVGYGTKQHREAIYLHGLTKYHRRSFLKGFEELEKPER
jgi:ribonuclease HII